MYRSNILTLITFSFLTISAASNLQAQTLSDPGFSQHNYKMPNKAARAKIQEMDQHFIIAMNKVSDPKPGQTSKYAVRPSSIMIALNNKKMPMNINPLSSLSNYKTQPVQKMQPNEEEYSASLN